MRTWIFQGNPEWLWLYAPQENFGVFGGALPGTIIRPNESLPAEMRYFDGNPPAELRAGGPWPQAKFSWVKETAEIAPGFHLISLTGKWGADFELREISLAIQQRLPQNRTADRAIPWLTQMR